MSTPRYCNECGASLGEMTDSEYQDFYDETTGACEVCLSEREAVAMDEEHDQFRDDVEADADVLRMAGFGTDEDYEHYDDFCDME